MERKLAEAQKLLLDVARFLTWTGDMWPKKTALFHKQRIETFLGMTVEPKRRRKND